MRLLLQFLASVNLVTFLGLTLLVLGFILIPLLIGFPLMILGAIILSIEILIRFLNLLPKGKLIKSQLKSALDRLRFKNSD